MVYVARQMGHAATLTLDTYSHVVDELEDAPNISADEAIAAARAEPEPLLRAAIRVA